MTRISSVIFIVLLLLTGNKTFSQMEVFKDGEELFYDVHYSFINVGWARFSTEKVTGKIDTYICRSELKSNDALPFVSVHYKFESLLRINKGKIEPLNYSAKEFKDDKSSELTYVFNYDSGFAAIKKTGYDGNIEYERKQTLNANYQDGISIFYDARYKSFQSGKRDAIVLMNNDSIGLNYDYNLKRDGISIDEVKDDVACISLKGYTNYQLVYGLTGDFAGWFTDDGARVPVKANLNVKIGKVVLELVKWNRGNWKPPIIN